MKHVVLALAVWSAAACARNDLVPIDCGTRGDGYSFCPPREDHVTPPKNWSEWVDRLGLPACPPAPVLVVTTTASQLDGGGGITDVTQAGPELSLHEALTIAANRAGPDTVTFDPEVFPSDSPRTILVAEELDFPSSLSHVCIDGRGAGVVVQWSQASTQKAWSLLDGSAMYGLTLLDLPSELEVTSSQVAGCRIGTDGVDVFFGDSSPPYVIVVHTQADIGPGNSFAGREDYSTAIAVLDSAQVAVRENYFGWDPVTRLDLALANAVELIGDATIVGNTVHVDVFGVTIRTNTVPNTVVITDNTVVCRNPTQATVGIQVATALGKVGPNVIRDCALGIRADMSTAAAISAHTFIDDLVAFVTDVVVPPPVIVSATDANATGSCVSAGTVELFTIDGGTIAYAGAAPCTPGSPWTIDAPSTFAPATSLIATLINPDGTSAFSSPVTLE